jgi:potassium-transporting ATPase KdpC subunit
MKTNIFPAIKLTLLCIVLLVFIYSGVVWGIAQVFAPNSGKGEVILKEGRIIGFTRVGQSFTQDNYFWSRPSAVSYNAAGSAGSNKGPSNPDYLATVQARIDTFMVHNPGIQKSQIPAELLTASGSGLDPHISYSAASVQISRIAKIRGISSDDLQQLVHQNIEKPWLGLFGPSQINVLKLNLALDNFKK